MAVDSLAKNNLARDGCKALFVTIATQQWEPMVQFYSHILGQEPQPHSPHSYAEFKIGGLKLGLFFPKESHQSEFSLPAQSAISLCMEVENLDHSRKIINVAYNRFKTGLTGYIEPNAHHRYGEIAIASHGRECYAYDPDGNRLILHEAG